MTPDVLQPFKVKSQRSRSQHEKVVQSLSFRESGSLNLMAMWEFWSEATEQQFVHMRSTKLAKNSPEQLARRQAPSSCNAYAIATFCTLKYFQTPLTSIQLTTTTFYKLRWSANPKVCDKLKTQQDSSVQTGMSGWLRFVCWLTSALRRIAFNCFRLLQWAARSRPSLSQNSSNSASSCHSLW